jgi:hypothetical protein
MISYRDFSKMYANNNGTRTLVESIAIPEVIVAATDFPLSPKNLPDFNRIAKERV